MNKQFEMTSEDIFIPHRGENIVSVDNETDEYFVQAVNEEGALLSALQDPYNTFAITVDEYPLYKRVIVDDWNPRNVFGR